MRIPRAVYFYCALFLLVMVGVFFGSAHCQTSEAKAKPAPWTLHYACDSSAPPALCYGSKDRVKNFRSREEAISFTESSYWFKPLHITHGTVEFACWWDYVNPSEDDPITAMAKEVDCDTDEQLTAKWCGETDCSERLNNHER